MRGHIVQSLSSFVVVCEMYFKTRKPRKHRVLSVQTSGYTNCHVTNEADGTNSITILVDNHRLAAQEALTPRWRHLAHGERTF
jgi:hypothetical protein